MAEWKFGAAGKWKWGGDGGKTNDGAESPAYLTANYTERKLHGCTNGRLVNFIKITVALNLLANVSKSMQ